MGKKIETSDLLFKLSNKYPIPRYAFLSEVRNQTGYGNTQDPIRTLDALALSLWKTDGYYLTGFELKISRSDWLHEVRDPSKSSAFVKYLDMFYLVVSDLRIVDISEVPENWGLMYLKNGRILTKKKAPKLEPISIDRSFLCGLLRNTTEGIAKKYILKDTYKKEIEKRVQTRIDNEVYFANKKAKDYDNLMENLNKFECSSGIDLKQLKYGWNKGEKIGDAVKRVLAGEDENIKNRLDRLLEISKKISGDIEKEIHKFDSLE